MSRIGKKPIEIPSGVTIIMEGSLLKVKGPKGELQQACPQGIQADVSEKEIVFSRASDLKRMKAFHGLTRSLAANMVKGVTEGFSKQLQIVGVGFRAKIEGADLILTLGFSHPVTFPIPGDVQIVVEENTKIQVSGIDKQRVGEMAAQIRKFYPPEPYKGKGIRYVGEYVRRKTGKTVA